MWKGFPEQVSPCQRDGSELGNLTPVCRDVATGRAGAFIWSLTDSGTPELGARSDTLFH